MVMCWAPDCKHYSVRERCKFFRFPNNKKERLRWKRLLRRDDEPGPTSAVCSCHFRDGKKENGPEIFLHNIAKRFQFDLLPEKVRTSRKKNSSPSTSQEGIFSGPSTSQEIILPGPSTSEDLILPGPSTSQEVILTGPSTPQEVILPGPSTSQDVIVHETSSNSNQLFHLKAASEAEIYFLKKEVEELKEEIRYKSVRFTYDNIAGNDNLIVLYTGLPNSKIFEALYNLIKDIDINYYLEWKVEKVQKIDQLLLTLMKLRLNTPHLDLAQRFAVSEGCVSNIFITFVHILYEILHNQLMGTMPSRHKNKTCLPTCFSNFTNCRVVLDCTEIFTVCARKSMHTQRLTYSNYKHHNTFKGLIGVAPNGVITYVSDLYVGSTSDQKIVKNCGILNLLETGDLVLADKGFLIQDILPVGVSLNIPPFLRSPQFTPEQVKCTENIARARIHVERAIRRMKCYRILCFMPESLCSYGDVVFKTVAALTNLQYPLIKEVTEMVTNEER